MKRILRGLCLLFFCTTAWCADYEVFEENGKVGLKDQSGKVVLPASFEALGWTDHSFSMAGQVTGYKQGDHWGLINLKKEFVTPANYEALTYSGGDRIIALRKIDAVKYKMGCINLQGVVTVPFQYDGIKIIGLRAVVFVKEENQFRYGLIDLENKIIIPIRYKNITEIGSLRYAVENENSRTALFSEQGNQIMGFSIDSISAFRQGTAFIYQGFKKGLIDRQGEIRINPLYRDIRIAPDGNMMVKKADEWIILENGNKEISKIEADRLVPSGTNYRITMDGKSGIINREMQVKIPMMYEELGDFKNGMAIAKLHHRYGIIRQNNSIILPFDSDSLVVRDSFILSQKDFMGSAAWSLYDTFGIVKTKRAYASMGLYNGKFFTVKNYGYYGTVDRYGEEIIHCVFDSLLEFRGDQVAVQFKGQYGIIDTHEKWILLPQAHRVMLVSEDRFLEDHDGTLFLKDFKNGIIYFTTNALNVHQDFLVEKSSDGREKKIDFQGREISVPVPFPEGQSRYILPESEGLRGIMKDGKYGFVDARGRLRIANRYEAISPFSEGLAAVKILGKWGYINPSDKIVINPSYTSASLFDHGVAIVERVGVKGMISKEGDILLPPRYDQIERISDQHFLITHKGLKGLVTASGGVLIEPRFDDLEILPNDHVLVKRDEKYGVLTLEGLSTIPLQYDMLIYDNVKNQFLALKKAEWKMN